MARVRLRPHRRRCRRRTSRPMSFSLDTLLAEAGRRAQKPYAPQRSAAAGRPRQAEPRTISQHTFQSRCGYLARRGPALPPGTAAPARHRTAHDRHALDRGGWHGARSGGHACHVPDRSLGAAAEQQGVAPPSRASAFAARSIPRRSGTNSWCSRGRVISAPSRSICCTVCRRVASLSTRRNHPVKNSRCSRTSGRRRPAPHATNIVVYALLESDSATGAYKFTGAARSRDHHGRRDDPLSPQRHAGGRHRAAHLHVPVRRDQSGPARRLPARGARLRRPHDCVEIRRAHIPTARESDHAAGVDLHHRSARRVRAGAAVAAGESDFQDFENEYERRPSAWVEPKGDWGAGGVELVEIPSGRESNDNIVAFLAPRARVHGGTSGALRISHQLARRSLPCPRTWARWHRHALGRQPRRQAPRVHSGFRGRRRENRRACISISAHRPARCRTRP